MGMAKSLMVVGEYDFYSSDYAEFATTIGHYYKVNVSLSFEESFPFLPVYCKPNEYIDLGFDNNYGLKVSNSLFDEKLPPENNTYFSYELHLPCELEDTDSLQLSFLPNGLFQLDYLPFSGVWQFYVEDIKGENDHYYNSHIEVVKEKLDVRNYYVELLSKINCSKVIQWTDGYYKTEEEFIFNQQQGKKNTLQQFIDALKTLDNMYIYNFIDALKQNITMDNSDNIRYLDVAYLDDFTNNY